MAHVRKRQFQPSPSSTQPSITSFFARVDPNNPPPDYDPYDRRHVPSMAPPLPTEIQSQLMNMGMRIRKSVPEGYKTHKTMPPQTPWLPPPPSSAPANSTVGLSHAHSETALPASSAPPVYCRPSELAPMCGLHKIGGYASQPSTSSSSSVPALSYSQSTLSSSQPSLETSTAAATPTNNNNNNTRKRNYDEEIEQELDAIFDQEAQQAAQHPSSPPLDADVAVSPKSKYPFSHSSMPELNRKSGFVRPGSRPKARMKAKTAFLTSTTHTDQATAKDFDDEDVAFLQPMDCD